MMGDIKVEARYQRAAPSLDDPLALKHQIGIRLSGSETIKFEVELVRDRGRRGVDEMVRGYVPQSVVAAAAKAADEFAERLYSMVLWRIGEALNDGRSIPNGTFEHRTASLHREIEGLNAQVVDLMNQLKLVTTQRDELRRIFVGEQVTISGSAVDAV